MLMHTMFLYPEPSFAYTAGDPNATAAIDADELDSGHHSPEHRPGWVALEPFSLTRLPIAAPVSPA